jgi:hypothetical protein
MLNKIKQNPEPFIRIIAVLILIIFILSVSENTISIELKGLFVGFTLVLARLTIVSCLGFLVYNLFLFFKLNRWSISSKKIKMLLLGIICSVFILLAMKALGL